MKKSKKFYAWKAKYIRKKRMYRFSRWNQSVKEFIRPYNTSHRQKERLGEHKIMLDKLTKFNFPGRHRHIGLWDWS